MSEELKTLKDIPCADYKSIELDIARLVWPSDLRQEAIKWIKHYNNLLENMAVDEYFANHSNFEGRIIILKHFFNIKEEELK